jgi:hypothetical protein
VGEEKEKRGASGGGREREAPVFALPMANDSLAHHLLFPFPAGCCSDDDVGPAFPFFWPPFPPLSPDSDATIFVPRRGMDRSSREAATSSATFFGFHDVDDDEWAPPDYGGEVELPLCWDCLRLEDHDDDHQRWWDVGVSDADQWEQVAGRGEEEEGAASAVRGLEWEVLLATNSLGSLALDDGDLDLDADIEAYFLDDVLFGRLAAEAGKGGRPAAKAAVEGLPTVVVAEARVSCAVCKDGVEAGESARRLPCAHLYHDGCILPWLAIRNTCPLCRHELPTDDPEYEKWKAMRAAGGGTAAGSTIASSGFLDEWIGAGGTD